MKVIQNIRIIRVSGFVRLIRVITSGHVMVATNVVMITKNNNCTHVCGKHSTVPLGE